MLYANKFNRPRVVTRPAARTTSTNGLLHLALATTASDETSGHQRNKCVRVLELGEEEKSIVEM